MKTVVSITGIRPDFIRMSFVFKELDKNFNHILIHTGQHYDNLLSDVFFKELGIRKPDFVLNSGKNSEDHFDQLSFLTQSIKALFKNKSINPDLIIFLGDSNSVGFSFPLKKAGYKIAHIEAGMRSYDKRMLEEINRTVCDHCSDLLFVYHEDYKNQLKMEGITDNVFVVGNTVVEPLGIFKANITKDPKKLNMILMDIHRPENFNYKTRLQSIVNFANLCIERYNIPVKLLYFKRLTDALQKFDIDLGKIEIIPLQPYTTYLQMVYDSKFLISDSGTAQEEPSLLDTRVIVPREFTERPQSIEFNCSHMLITPERAFKWLELMNDIPFETGWLGDGKTSKTIVETIITSLFTINSTIDTEIFSDPFPHLCQDNFLEPSFATDIQHEILNIPDDAWDRYENPFESKNTLRNKFTMPPKLDLLFGFLTSKEFVRKLSKKVGYDLQLDLSRNFWGVHKYKPGDKLDIHVDAGYHPTSNLKKQVTLGIYLSTEDESGCALELWKGDNCTEVNPKLTEKVKSIDPVFNRLILFVCNDYSWHGNPEPTKTGNRIFVTLSYLTQNCTDDKNLRKKAYFIARPSDPEDKRKDELRALRADVEKCKQVYNIV